MQKQATVFYMWGMNLRNFEDILDGEFNNLRLARHICQVYTKKEEYRNRLAVFINLGLMSNELCVWLYPRGMTLEEAGGTIGLCVPDYKDYIETGQLLLQSGENWYVEENIVDKKTIEKMFNNLLKGALEKGFDGLRISGNLKAREFDLKTLKIYEELHNEIILNNPYRFFCLYDVNKCSANKVLETIKLHTYCVIGENDIIDTMKKEDIKKIKERERFNNELVDILPKALFVHRDDKIMFCNSLAKYFLGVKSKSDVIGKSFIETFAINNNKVNELVFADEKIQEIYKDEIDYYSGEYIGSDNKEKQIEIISKSLKYYGENVTISVVKDITYYKTIEELRGNFLAKQKELDKTLELDKIRAEFFANISHELRTPITVLLTAIQYLDSKGEIKSYKYVNIMRQNCYRLLRTVNNLIDITKIDTEFFTVKFKNKDIVKIIQEIVFSVSEFGKSKGLEIVFRTDVEEIILAFDPDLIERIMLNLLSNAIKYTLAGGKILVYMHEKEGKVIISVRDTGSGIPEGKAKIIFERFRQVDCSLARPREGSGIGLYLVKSLVEKHYGKIYLNTQYKQGAEFIVELPISLAKEECGELKRDKDDYEVGCVERMNLEFSDIYA